MSEQETISPSEAREKSAVSRPEKLSRMIAGAMAAIKLASGNGYYETTLEFDRRGPVDGLVQKLNDIGYDAREFILCSKSGDNFVSITISWIHTKEAKQ